MSATLFQMGFRSGGFQALPMELGLNVQGISSDIQRYVKEAQDLAQLLPGNVPSSMRPPPPPPPPPPSMILGLPSSTVMVGGALLLGGGVLAAVLLSRKK